MGETALTLVDHLQHVPDFRRKEGKRYPLPALLVLFIMAIMSGHYGYREIARFLKANREALIKELGLRREAMPSHVTVRTVLQGLDFDHLNWAFQQWASDHLHLEPSSWVALDAKAIRSTVSDYEGPYQDFVSLVSAFAQREGLVVATARYYNKHKSEIVATQEVIEALVTALDVRGVAFTLDALHCKKNGAADRRERERLPHQGEGEPAQALAGDRGRGRHGEAA
jgi:hypothetical protein